mmetsp:Transcript_32651/g.43085  ORF Transcript_32651/g.43085 Transcript_32651/m.43085 type:complete len:123 (-) Transcript_32651:96-464(-)
MLDPDQPIYEMDLVEIRSHTGDDTAITDATKQLVVAQNGGSCSEESKKMMREEVKGFALTVKESYAEEIMRICSSVRPLTFLKSGAAAACSDEHRPLMCSGGADQLVIVADEAALIGAVDQK